MQVTKKEILLNEEEILLLHPYIKVFDDDNPNWNREPQYNMLYLRSMENYLNDRLRARGHLFLNEVYDWLGFERTSIGAIHGWIIGDRNANQVVFNINADVGDIQIDFNVDGQIYDKI